MLALATKRGAPRNISQRQYQTFDSAFESGLDKRLWTETGYPWITDNNNPGQQIIINEEQQYYLQRTEHRAALGFDPWFINDRGNLVLRCIKTPAAYRHLACGVVDTYRIVHFDARRRRITVSGNPWQDPYSGEQFIGINRYLRDDVRKTGYGYLCIGDSPTKLMYLRIEKEPQTDPYASQDVTTAHTFELIDDIPNPEQIKHGVSTLKLLRHMPYMSGMLSTRGAFAQTYGSWHIRMRLPAGRGTLAGALTWPNYSADQANQLTLAERSTGVNLFEQPGHESIQYHSIYNASPNENNRRESSLPDAFLHPSRQDQNVLQHAVQIDNQHAHYIDARNDWIEVIWDWYPDNSCAWFVKTDDQFLETGRSRLPGGDQADGMAPRMILLKNAFDSWFNRKCEVQDYRKGVRTIDLKTPPPWDLEVDFIRAYQWEGFPPFMGKLPGTPEEIQALAARLQQSNMTLSRAAA